MTKFDIFVVNLRRSVDRREAMREKIAKIQGFKAIYIDDELVVDFTHPLAPSAREGELNSNARNATKSSQQSASFTTKAKQPLNDSNDSPSIACARGDSSDSPSLARGDSQHSPSLAKLPPSISPSLAEGARGWVDSNNPHSTLPLNPPPQESGKDFTQSVESSKKNKSKKPIKSFCYFWLVPKVESPLPLNPNLPNNVISAQSAKIALHFHFFPATDATKFKNGDSPLPPQYSSKLTRFVKGKDLSFGEMACFSSHYRLWQKCVALDSPIIVLEDDIDFMQDFCQIVDIFKSPFEYVRLHYTMDKKTTHLRYNFYMSYDKVCGTLGYYLTPQAAQKFIKNTRFWLFCVDDYMDMFFIHSVKNIIFKPFIISEDLHSATQSTILGREKPQMRFYQKLTRELSRIYFFAIRKYLYFALHFVEIRAFFRAHKVAQKK